MTQPFEPPCTSASNCLVVIHTADGVELHSSRRPTLWLTVDTDEWEAHEAGVRAAALTEAAELLRRRAGEAVGADARAAIRYAANAVRVLAETPTPPLSATETAEDAPPVPQVPPEPQELLTPDEWLAREFAGWRILDPDGWLGHDALPWKTPLTRGEFQRRLVRSTVSAPTTPPGSHEQTRYIGLLTADAQLLRKVADERDTAQAAAETFRSELDRTGEQLLAVTAERDTLASVCDFASGAIDDLATERDQLRERVDGDAWDAILAERDAARSWAEKCEAAATKAMDERDRLAETLRGADPYADTGIDRLAEYLAEHWPARTQLANEAERSPADLAIDVIKHKCGELAECYADLARMSAVVDAAVAWRDAGWNTHAGGPATALLAAVDAWTAKSDGDGR